MIDRYVILFCSLFAFVNAIAQNNPSYQSAPDSVVAHASNRYAPSSFLRRILMGSNYRKEWRTPVHLPVFHLASSGFTIKGLGGGMQTKSLQLLDSRGKQWALRTVDKEVSGAMPPWARNTAAQKASQDLISASFPYGAPIAGALAKAAGINSATPKIYFVGDDEALGAYRSIFSNTICLLEERDPGFDSTVNSRQLLTLLKEGNNHIIDQKVLLRARLLDMLVADWDRHENNWRWGVKDSGRLKIYYAIPRDRDWAFYRSKGLLPTLAKLMVMPFLTGFKNKMNSKAVSFKAWTFDKALLGELTSEDWENVIEEFQQSLTDVAIEDAVKTMPPPIYDLVGKHFISTLKNRRDGLHNSVMKYYKFLAEDAIINGSDKDEIFRLTASNEGLTVSVYQLTNGKPEHQLFSRTYSPDETHYITINGFGGDDSFEVAENAISKIKVRINGGEGMDSYNIKGHLKVSIFDRARDNNTMIATSGATIHLE